MSSKTNSSILTLNVRGLRSTTKRTTVFQWLLAQNVDIILLQETYFTKCNKYKIMKQWNGKSIHGYSNSLLSKGVSLLFKPGLDVKVENEYFCNDGRKLIANVKINDINYSIINLYAPANVTERREFFITAGKWCKENVLYDSNVIVGGDFNTVDNIQDRLSGKTDASSSNFSKF